MMQPVYDDEELPLPDVGPIITAHVEGLRTTLVGERGVADFLRLPTAIDLGAPPPSLRVVPVNAGAAHAAEVEEGEPMWQERQVQDQERLTFAEIVSLMRHPIPPGVHSSGNNGGGRAKKMPLKIVTPTVDDDDAPEVKARLRERVYQIVGLSPGVTEFYVRRHGLNVQVLRALALRMGSGEYVDRREVRSQVSRLSPHDVCGLLEDEIIILKSYPGAARAELTRYAMETDPSRVIAIDLGATERGKR